MSKTTSMPRGPGKPFRAGNRFGKGRPVQLKLPEDFSTAEGLAHALTAILSSAAQGEITIGDAVQLASLLETGRKIIETQEFERRLGEMEKKIG